MDVTLTAQYSMSSAVTPNLNMMDANGMLDYAGAASSRSFVGRSCIYSR